jgi:hypothetical protein
MGIARGVVDMGMADIVSFEFLIAMSSRANRRFPQGISSSCFSDP